MRSVKLVAVVTLLATGMVFAQSQIAYTVETGGDNSTYQWEAKAAPQPFFKSGATDNSSTVEQGQDLTWAVRVTVSGAQTGGPGDGLETWGAANLVFDLQLFQADGSTPVASFGAAPLTCTTGSPGVAGAKACKPSGMGFWSSINDGDTDNPNNPGEQQIDTLANAAFAFGIYTYNSSAPSGPAWPPTVGTTVYRLIDGAGADPLNAPQAPAFDYGWYPTSNGRGGIDTEGSKPINTGVTTVNSALVGFGAGYKSYDAATHRAGVGMNDLAFDYGYGADRPLFEGQINTKDLPVGTYVLKVVPSADGNNVIHGSVIWDSTTPNYGGNGSFAAKANSVAGSQVSFRVTPPSITTAIAGRYVFYNNCSFDGNRVAVDTAPVTGANNDDGDAVDTTKTALVETAGADVSGFANYTSYTKGLNGLVYDVVVGTGYRAPVASDFTFQYYGRTGTSAPVTKSATAVVTWLNTPVAGTNRTFVAFANNDIQKGWLKVTVGTGFGAPAEVHWWGNAIGEAKNDVTNLVINALDYSKIKGSYTAGPTAIVSYDWDFDKNRTCNSLDNSTAKANSTSPALAVSRITK